MSDPNTIATIIGFVFFGVSEILPFLPIRGNGMLQSILEGLKGSCGSVDKDVELAQQLINHKPTIANVVTTMTTNDVIHNCFKNILDNQNVIPYINLLCNNQELQTIFHSLNSNPALLNNIKNVIKSVSDG